MYSNRMPTVCSSSRLLGGCTWSKGGGGVYLVRGDVPGLGGCTWSRGYTCCRGVYLVGGYLPGGCTWSGGCSCSRGCTCPGECTWSRGAPGPGGCTLSGGCTCSQGGGHLLPGGAPGPGGVYVVRGSTWPGTPPSPWTE